MVLFEPEKSLETGVIGNHEDPSHEDPVAPRFLSKLVKLGDNKDEGRTDVAPDICNGAAIGGNCAGEDSA